MVMQAEVVVELVMAGMAESPISTLIVINHRMHTDKVLLHLLWDIRIYINKDKVTQVLFLLISISILLRPNLSLTRNLMVQYQEASIMVCRHIIRLSCILLLLYLMAMPKVFTFIQVVVQRNSLLLSLRTASKTVRRSKVSRHHQDRLRLVKRVRFLSRNQACLFLNRV